MEQSWGWNGFKIERGFDFFILGKVLAHVRQPSTVSKHMVKPLSLIHLQQVWIQHSNLTGFRQKTVPLCHCTHFQGRTNKEAKKKKKKSHSLNGVCYASSLLSLHSLTLRVNTADTVSCNSKGPKVEWRQCCSMPGVWSHAWITACYDNGVKASSR